MFFELKYRRYESYIPRAHAIDSRYTGKRHTTFACGRARYWLRTRTSWFFLGVLRGFLHLSCTIPQPHHDQIHLQRISDIPILLFYGHSLSFLSRRRRGSSQRGSDYPDVSMDNDQGAVDLSGLSFVERQEEWLRRKQHTLRAKTQDLERAVKDAATFNPNLAISQSSLRPAQVGGLC